MSASRPEAVVARGLHTPPAPALAPAPDVAPLFRPDRPLQLSPRCVKDPDAPGAEATGGAVSPGHLADRRCCPFKFYFKAPIPALEANSGRRTMSGDKSFSIFAVSHASGSECSC